MTCGVERCPSETDSSIDSKCGHIKNFEPQVLKDLAPLRWLVQNAAAESFRNSRTTGTQRRSHGFSKELANQFSPGNRVLMAQGKAPFVADSQSVGGATRYNLHHINPIHNGGGVYDLDNLAVVTPRFYAEILDPEFDYNR
ncbi:hypothetical protein [Nocardia sp. NPDC127526]|uniref:hypothetical protein n=1 Tax=Nocardia sp. NPDC127526 TaxID=3345393 RepID=UPI003645B9FE